jgi:hypothetical protein
MQLTPANMLRVHRQEITPAQAFAEQAAAEAMPSRHGIPHILHFIWFGNEEPELVTWLRQSVVDQYPGWQVRVWRDKPTDWPQEWEEAFERGGDDPVHKSDVLRWWPLLTMGGIYYDSDFLGVRPLPTSVLDAEFTGSFGGRGARRGNRVRIAGKTRSALCGILASVPHGKIVTAMVKDMLSVQTQEWGATGMNVLARGIKRGGVHLINPAQIYAVGSSRRGNTWDKAYQHAMHEPKAPAECAVHLWLGGKGYTACNEQFLAERTATAAVTTMVLNSRALAAIRAVGIRAGLPIRGYCTRDRWRRRRRDTTNFATWGVKWPSSWYARGGRNILYLENALLKQNSGIYVDHAGYFCDSSIATEPQPDPTHTEVAALQAHCAKRFGWPWFAGGDPTGPIMIALQTHNDCSVRYHYHPGRGDAPAMQPLLDACADYLPQGVPVIVRPHPKERKPIDPNWPARLRPRWALDPSKDVYATLRTCRAMVTVSSTLATEALALGLPVACLGRSAWEGHSVVLECANDYARLAGLADWTPEEWPVLRYLCAVMRHQLPYNATPDQVQANASVRTWLERAGRPIQTQCLADQVTAAAAQIRAANDPLALEHLLALEAKLADCKVCRRARLQRRIIDLARQEVSPLA